MTNARANRPDAAETDSTTPNPRPSRLPFFKRQLPLETETTFFVLANALDVFVTFVLLNFEQFRESNAIANYFLTKYGIRGMVYFKFAIVAVVAIIAQIIATRRPRTAKCLLNGGSFVVFAVVIYSITLFVKHFPKN